MKETREDETKKKRSTKSVDRKIKLNTQKIERGLNKKLRKRKLTKEINEK